MEDRGRPQRAGNRTASSSTTRQGHLSRSGPRRAGSVRLRRIHAVLRRPGPGPWLRVVEERRHGRRDRPRERHPSRPGVVRSHPNRAVRRPGAVLHLFAADESRSGLWISDGTEAGTLRLESQPFVSNIIAAGNRAFFLSFTDETGPELGVTDGTVAGTHVIDARPGPEGLGDSYWFAALGNNLIFSPTERRSAGNLLRAVGQRRHGRGHPAAEGHRAGILRVRPEGVHRGG